MGEFELIRRYFAAAACARVAPPVSLGIGDDCALLQPLAGEQLAVSTDTLVEGVHFPFDANPFLLGQRALGVSASDLAAMGATPVGFTLALTLPTASETWLQALAQGLQQMASACRMSLIGGDTTRGPLSMTLTVFGSVPAGQALLRSRARVGQCLCIGSTLGEAAAALPWVLGQRAEDAVSEPLLARYWSPRPQFELGLALRERGAAALDVSDGLLADCGHIARASSVALVIEAERVPLSEALRAAAGEQAFSLALSGGDDYCLAFTLDEADVQLLQRRGHGIQRIGRVEPGQGVRVVDAAGVALELPRHGYQHFGAD